MNLLSHMIKIGHQNVGHLSLSPRTAAIVIKRSLSTSQWKKYLNILKVDNQSTPKDIKDSFLKLSKIYHPDNKLTGSHLKFVELKEAYDALKDGRANKGPSTSPSATNYYDSDLSHEAHQRYRAQNRYYTEDRGYGFGGPYRDSDDPWQTLRTAREYRRHKNYSENFGKKGRPLINLTIILSAVAWIVIYSGAMMIWGYNDKSRSGVSQYRARGYEDYLAYQEYLKRKEFERLSRIKELAKLVEERRKQPPQEAPETIKSL